VGRQLQPTPPLWDNDEDERLFTPEAMRDAETLIRMLADEGIVMALPKGIPTLKHMATNLYLRPTMFGAARGCSLYSCDVKWTASNNPHALTTSQ